MTDAFMVQAWRRHVTIRYPTPQALSKADRSQHDQNHCICRGKSNMFSSTRSSIRLPTTQNKCARIREKTCQIVCGSGPMRKLTSAGFNVGLNFSSNVLLRTVRGKMLFQFAWDEGSESGCHQGLLSSFRLLCFSRIGPTGPSSHFSSSARKFCCLHRSGTRTCRKSAASSTQKIQDVEAFTFCPG